jgi:aspartate aminotransferase
MTKAASLAERISRISVSTTMRVAAEADRLRREGVDVVDLAPGEPDFPTPEHVKRAAIRAIEENFTKYTVATGIPELKDAIARRHAADFGTRYSPEECMASVGGKHVIFNAVQVLVDHGDEVIIPVPYWVTFRDLVQYSGGTCAFVPPDEESGFRLTAAMIEPLLGPRTKLLIVNSPSNPSGAVIDPEEFERILHLVSRRGIYLVSDECYCHFVYQGSPYSIASAPGAKDHAIVAGSVSKTYSMTGWRIGFGLGPKPIIDAMAKLQGHTTSNPTSVAQKAALEALSGPQDSIAQMLAEYRVRREYVIQRLRQIPGLCCSEPMGAFYAYPNIGDALDTIQFSERLLEQERVAVVPGEAFGTDRHVRISYATSMSELERGLDRIGRFVTSLSR